MKSGKMIFALALAMTANAQAAGDKHIVIAPKCLVNAANTQPEIMATKSEMLLIRTNSAGIEALSDSKHRQKAACGGFIDVTSHWQQQQMTRGANSDSAFLARQLATPQTTSSTSYSIRYQQQANLLIGQLNPQLMWDSLTTFTNSRDRYADSDEGVAATKWIATEIETAAKTAGRDDVTVSFIATKNHLQPSVVVKVGNSNEAGVVIGAHLDTTSGKREIKPGADDDGSGSMTTLESARTVIKSGMKFKKPIYYVWYAAEELGLLGSQAVVKDFQQKKIPIAAVMQFDMTGFAYKNQSTIWIIDDYVDPALTKFLGEVIKTYTQRDIKMTRCGYACSDHATWTKAGFKAVIPAESRFEDTNPVAHTSSDTMDRLSLAHMTDYAKIATAFATELAEPI